MRAVIDTNILVSSFMRPDTPPAALRRALITGDFELCLSQPLLDELEDVLGREHLAKYLKVPREDIEEFLARLPGLAHWVEEEELEVEAVTVDPDDDVVVATALAGRAQVLVSSDKHLLALRPEYRGVAVMTLGEFVEMLERA